MKHECNNESLAVDYYAIHEVYYYGGNNKVSGWTDSPTLLLDEELKDLKGSIKLIAEAFKRPILSFKTGKEIKG